jgi:hypothetical protein
VAQKRTALLCLVSAVLLGCAASVFACPPGDLDENCSVDWRDLGILAQGWLVSYDAADFVLLAGNWRQLEAPLLITEFMASNRLTLLDGDGESSDWIEIHNPTGTPIRLNGWYLTDDDRNLTVWRFPDGILLGPGGYIVVFASGQDDANYPYLDPNGYYHTNFKLGKGGEYLALVAADGQTISHKYDSYEYDDGEFGFPFQKTDYSYGIISNDPNQERYFNAPATPGATNGATVLGLVADTKFNYDRGFYTTGFSLQITTDTPAANIYYTLNGSEPTPSTGTLYIGPLAVNGTCCVRAAAFKTGWLPTNVDTQTYVFPNDVKLQPQMDPNIVNDPCYSGIIVDALRSLPSLSIVMDEVDFANLQAQSTYPAGSPPKEELPTSVEMLYPDSRNGFQTDCAIEGHSWNIPKRAFRLKFIRDFGPGKLKFPFFQSAALNAQSAVEEFDRLVLRGGKNMSWAYGGGDSVTYADDQWVRDTQIAMSEVSSHGNFVHLYINGKYWGLYNPVERPDKWFMSSYFGSEPEDWLSSNHGLERGQGHLDGDSTRYNQMMALADGKKLEDAGKYEQFRQYLDVPQYIDYVILYWYAGMGDGIDNNWYGGNCNNPPGPYMFFMWDSEIIFIDWVSDSPGHAGAWVNPLFLDPTPDAKFDATTIIRLWKSARENEDFVMTFADRVYKHCFNGGALDETVSRQRWQILTDSIADAVVCESARWGDEQSPGAPKTRDNHWLAAVQTVDGQMSGNAAQFISALRAENFYPTIDPSVFRVNGINQHGGYISAGDLVSMTAGAGMIYYTIDGTDPRQTLALVPENADKAVLVPAAAVNSAWKTDPNFDDSLWTHGTPVVPGKTGGAGYERSSAYDDYISYDVETRMYHINGTCYIRIPFTFSGSVNDVDFMTLRMRYDDAFVAYLNGSEVARAGGVPASLQHNSEATAEHQSQGFESFDISSHANDLVHGNNLLAIHGLNIKSGQSPDFLISAELVVNLPGRTQFTAPFTLDKSTLIKTRVLDANGWSALSEAAFAMGDVAGNLRITEIMYHPPDPNDPNAEFVELKNTGPNSLNLNLVSFTEGIHFTFPPVELGPGEYILVVSDQNTFVAQYGTEPNVAGQYTGRLDNGGERIRLEDAAGGTILDFRYSDDWRSITDGLGFSLTIIDPNNPDTNSWGLQQSWRPSAYAGGSPGLDDTGVLPAPGSVVINEVMSHSHGDASDWIELYNATDQPVNIGGWFISDSDTNILKYRIAEDTLLDANSFIVFYEDSNFGSASTDPGRLEPFALSENGELVCLSSALDGVPTGYREVEDFGASETGVSFGRYYKPSTDSFNFVVMESNTPGWANSYPKVGPVVISEIMYHPQLNPDAEYIELYNITDADVNLYDGENNPWKLTDGVTFIFPPDANIPAHGYLLTVLNLAVFNAQYPCVPAGVQKLQWQSGRLDNAGEKVEIGMPGDLDEYGQRCYIRIDRVNYSDGSHPENFPGGLDLWPPEADGNGMSLTSIDPNLYGNDVANWEARVPSPGSD